MKLKTRKDLRLRHSARRLPGFPTNILERRFRCELKTWLIEVRESKKLILVTADRPTAWQAGRLGDEEQHHCCQTGLHSKGGLSLKKVKIVHLKWRLATRTCTPPSSRSRGRGWTTTPLWETGPGFAGSSSTSSLHSGCNSSSMDVDFDKYTNMFKDSKQLVQVK